MRQDFHVKMYHGFVASSQARVAMHRFDNGAAQFL